jgi:hypothetical protein
MIDKIKNKRKTRNVMTPRLERDTGFVNGKLQLHVSKMGEEGRGGGGN